MPERLRIGVVGCGLIAQVMHLHYLRELADRFEIAALCDVSEELARACAGDYGVPRTFARWQDLLAAPLDAVLILTSGSHAPITIAAAEAGKHMLIEKPMCFSVAEGRAMIEAARRAGVTLMVGYNKRYDPAYRRLCEEIRSLSDLRAARDDAGITPPALHRALSVAQGGKPRARSGRGFPGRQPGPHHGGHRRGGAAGAPCLSPRAPGQPRA